jgi:hypothetical protein
VRQLCLLAVVAVAVAGCGSKDTPKPAATTSAQTSTSATAPKPSNAEPKGKLSAAEYRSVRAAYKMLVPLDNSKNLRKVVRTGTRACTKVTTQTELLATVHTDCVRIMRFYGKAAALVTRRAECIRAAQAGDTSCWADVFRSVGRSARLAGEQRAMVNKVLRKRAIRGDCAAALGYDRQELAVPRDVLRAGLGAAHALEAKNQGAFERAARNLTDALDRFDSGNSSMRDSFRRLKACV